MVVEPILIDSRPRCLSAPDGASSLLLTPCGTGTLLGMLRERLPAALSRRLAVLPQFDPDASYPDALRAAGGGCEVQVARGVGEIADRHEPSDWALFIDAACFSPQEFTAAQIDEAARDPRCVTHWFEGDDPGFAEERLVVDERGVVQRIQRFYAGFTSLGDRAVGGSLVSGAVLAVLGRRPFETLEHQRQTLMREQVPTRDVLLTQRFIDLSREAGLLELMEHGVCQTVAAVRRGGAGGSRGPAYVGPGCRVHASARICGPVVLQQDVTLEAGATVVGPALLGVGSRVGRGALVAHSLVGCGGTVPAGATIQNRVLPSTNGRAPTAHPLRAARSRRARTGRDAARAAADAQRGERDPLRRRAYAGVKRGCEALLAATALLILSPLLLVVALLIKLDSRGPVLYRDLREGKGGRVFRCLKFRTMVPDAHGRQRDLYGRSQVDGPQFKIEDDPRLTRIGGWLRATNIDELPQLINVLAGQMSLIGPRPSPFRENQICAPWREARLSVRPGITGLWQICRHERAAGDFHQWIFYDMLYVRHMSLLLDLKIMAATLATFGGRWSVPLRWMIRTDRVFGEEFGGAALGTPILATADEQPDRSRRGAAPGSDRRPA